MQNWIVDFQSTPALSDLSGEDRSVSLLIILWRMRSWVAVWLRKAVCCRYIIFLSLIICYLLLLASWGRISWDKEDWWESCYCLPFICNNFTNNLIFWTILTLSNPIQFKRCFFINHADYLTEQPSILYIDHLAGLKTQYALWSTSSTTHRAPPLIKSSLIHSTLTASTAVRVTTETAIIRIGKSDSFFKIFLYYLRLGDVYGSFQILLRRISTSKAQRGPWLW